MGIVRILLGIKSKVIFLVDDLGNVEDGTGVVVDGVALKRKMGREPSVGVVQCRTNDVDPKDEGGEDVEDSPNRHNERRSDVSNLTPW